MTRTRRNAALEHVALALAAFLPVLLARPGVVTADTKTYLYVDPGRFLRQSASIWDPSVGLGTVTHQQIGYLFPMGPFFWATHAAGVPTWVAQRLWIGALLLAAGAGVLFLCRTLAVAAPGRFVASFCYMVSPYALQYLGHISVILLAWAALPWLVALVARQVERGGWRNAAALALIAAAMGSVNASSAVYVAVAPLLWLLYAGLRHLSPWRRVGQALWRCGLLSAAVSAWWIVGLFVEGRNGIDVLKYTETVDAVSSTSLSSEVLRGLGYWYFYGTDPAGPWVPSAIPFTQDLWLIGVGYGVPLLSIAGAFVTRWRHRAFFVGLVLVGLVLAVGAYPVFDPSPVGRMLRALFTETRAGMALRSTDRAAPLLLLGMAVLVGAAVTAMSNRTRLAGLGLALGAVGLAAAANPSLWNGGWIPTSFTEPASPPAYVTQAARALNEQPASSRVLALPGESFAAYRYGMTVDPLWPGILTRPFVTREQQVLGSVVDENLLYGLDDPIQTGTADPASLAPIARLLSVGSVLVQNDLAYERYHQPDPSLLWTLFSNGLPGLGQPVAFGTPRVNDAPARSVDEGTLSVLATTPPPPPVATLSVADPRPVERLEPADNALVVDGDGSGLVQVAGAGLLAGDPAVVYAGTLAGDGPLRRAVLGDGADLVVTDSNRRQAFRWDDLTEVAGRTLAADQAYPSHDPASEPVDLFPAAGTAGQTTSQLVGVNSVSASSYGNPFAYLPEDRPAEALDGNIDTAWETDTFGNPAGQWWQVKYLAPVTADAVRIVQPIRGGNNQWLTVVTLRFDNDKGMRFRLDASSRTPTGQLVRFPRRRFRILQIDIDATNLPPAHTAGGSPVGLAEVQVDDITAAEQIVMPTDLLRSMGTTSASHRLTVVMTRQRIAPLPPRTDPEPALDRVLWLPTSRTFTLTGTARIDQLVPDSVVDAVIGRPRGAGHVTASAGERMLSTLYDTGAAALDGDPATAWSPPFGRDHQVGEHLTVAVPNPISVDHMTLQLVADGRHSVPTSLLLSTSSSSDLVQLPTVRDGSAPGTVVSVPVTFRPLTGTVFTFTVTGVRLHYTYDDDSGNRTVAPIAVAELGIPGVTVPPPPADIPSPCRSDLLFVDGHPVDVSVHGTSAGAVAGTGLALTLCGADAGGLTLAPGEHVITGALGQDTGLDLDQLVLDSAAGGTTPSIPPPRSPVAPAVRVVTAGDTSIQITVTRPSGPSLLVLGESINSGWTATLSGGRALGPPQLVDGFANGWLVTPDEFGGRSQATVVLRFAPQTDVNVALAVSAGTGGLCLAILLWPRRRRRAHRSSVDHELSKPILQWPWQANSPSSPKRAVAVGIATGVVAGALTSWWVVAPVAVAVAVAHSMRRGRILLALGSVGLVLSTVVTMLAVQAHRGLAENGGWPSHFGLANSLTWGAVVLLAADVAVELTRRARPAPRPGSRPPSPPT